MNWLKRLLAPKFITANCFIINKSIQEMGISQSGEPARLLIRLAAIDSLRETLSEEQDNIHECIIYYRSGDIVVVDRSYNQMYRLLKKYGYL